jgi:hypothetical protein
MWKQLAFTSIATFLVAQSAIASSDATQTIGDRTVPANIEVTAPAIDILDQPHTRIDRDTDPNFTKVIIDEELLECWGISSGDLDDDGDLDIAISQYYQGEIDWYENRGNYEFTFHQLYQTSSDVYHLEIVDLDNDDDLDVIYGEGHSGVHVLLNDGEMNFTHELISDAFYWKFVVVDLNQDGLLDLIGNNNSWVGTTSWAEQQPDHSFVTHLIDDDAGDGYGIDAVDLDGDDDIDIVQGVINQFDHLYGYINDGEESFTRIVIDDMIDDPLDLVCEDLDDDGDQDILVAASITQVFGWYENLNNLEFDLHIITGSIERMWFVAAGDLDLNGTMDVATASRLCGIFTWFSNDGEGSFTDINIDECIEYPQDFIYLDIEEDGDLDIAMVSGRSQFGDFNHGQLTLYLNEYGSEGVTSESSITPPSSSLLRNYPNPFNPSTTIEFELKQQGAVQLAVYTVLGQRVALLAEAEYPAGNHQVRFDGTALASGVYLCRLIATDDVTTRKLVLIR